MFRKSVRSLPGRLEMTLSMLTVSLSSNSTDWLLHCKRRQWYIYEWTQTGLELPVCTCIRGKYFGMSTTSHLWRRQCWPWPRTVLKEQYRIWNVEFHVSLCYLFQHSLTFPVLFLYSNILRVYYGLICRCWDFIKFQDVSWTIYHKYSAQTALLEIKGT